MITFLMIKYPLFYQTVMMIGSMCTYVNLCKAMYWSWQIISSSLCKSLKNLLIQDFPRSENHWPKAIIHFVWHYVLYINQSCLFSRRKRDVRERERGSSKHYLSGVSVLERKTEGRVTPLSRKHDPFNILESSDPQN